MASKKLNANPLIVGFTLLCLSLSIISCSPQPRASRFDYEPFVVDQYGILLCFDLRNETQISAGLIIKPVASVTSTQHMILLPFESESVAFKDTWLTTWGAYKNTTLITYVSFPKWTDTLTLGLTPQLGSPPVESPYSIESLPKSLYLITSGLERRFIYKYPEQESDYGRRIRELQGILKDEIEAIGIALPQGAIGKEVRGSSTSVPPPEFENALAKFYPASRAKADSAYLELRYELPATRVQLLISEFLVKLFGALFLPVFQLFILFFGEQNKSWKKVLLVLSAVGQGCLILILSIIIFNDININGRIELKTISDFALILITAIFSLILFAAQRRSKKKKASHHD